MGTRSMNAESNRASMRRLTQFSLRSLLTVMMLVGAYIAGWMSHRAWNRRHVAETVSQALNNADFPVDVEAVDGTQILVTSGRKEDVEEAVPVIEEVQQAARQ